MVLSAMQVHAANDTSICSSVLVGLTIATKRHINTQTYRQTDRPRYLRINIPHHMLCTAMRPNKNRLQRYKSKKS